MCLNEPATTATDTLSLHDALPISLTTTCCLSCRFSSARRTLATNRSEEHTSELQSRGHLVCRLLLEKKKDFLPPVCVSTSRRPPRPTLFPYTTLFRSA